MSDFKVSILKTLTHEGGFQKNQNDHANWSSGVIGQGTLIGTKYGITALDMPGADIEHLTEDQAVAYYSERYWKPLYSQITSQPLADKLFDSGVLFGVGTAVGVLQLTLDITVDHVFGPNTLAAINQTEETSLLSHYKGNLVTHAFNIVTANPAERIFIKGWVDRVNS